MEKSEAAANDAEPRCPPSVSGELWDLIPRAARKEAIRRAARDLRRAVHPEASLRAFLAERGIVVAGKAAAGAAAPSDWFKSRADSSGGGSAR